VNAMSPLAPTASGTDTIITISDAAIAKLKELRDVEPDAESLGLRLEIATVAGNEFRYDLSFDEFRKAAFTDEVRTHDGLKVIIPQRDLPNLRAAVLDYNDAQGLVLRNPNTPPPPSVDGLVGDDELAGKVRALVTEQVNPALAAHGGFVTFVGHDNEGTAYFTMGGGCHGCSMSTATMLDGVQTMLSEALPEITKVRDLTDHATGENPYYA
jgi:Fe/S biogenesis protein NfuA